MGEMQPKPVLMEGIRVLVGEGCWWLSYWPHPGGALRGCLEPLSSLGFSIGARRGLWQGGADRKTKGKT